MSKRHTKSKTGHNVSIKPKKRKTPVIQDRKTQRKISRNKPVRKPSKKAAKGNQKSKLVSKGTKVHKVRASKLLRRNQRPKVGTKKSGSIRTNSKGKSKARILQTSLRKTNAKKAGQRKRFEKINKRSAKSNLTNKNKITPRIGFVKHFGKRVKDTNTGQYRRAYTIDLSGISGIENKLNYLRNADFSFIDKFKFYRISKDNYAVMKDYFIQIVRKVKQQLYYSKLYFGFPPGEFDSIFIKKFTIDTLVEYNNEFTDRLAEDEDGDYLQGSGATFNPSKIIGIQMQFVYFNTDKQK